MAPFPARLHILLASQAPFGVVIRRGPSKQVCTFLWDRLQDRFTLGQWFKGRIYERRSDLSPDGKYLIYFAMNGKWNSETGGSWTAISRAPWLKAITLLAKGDCWNGGGLFTGKGTYWLNEGCPHRLMQESRELSRDTLYQPKEYYSGECPGVYYRRLQRDGWIYQGKWQNLDVFEKKLELGWILRKLAHAEINAPLGKSCYWDEHELEHAVTGVTLKYPEWEWAEWERNRLVWAVGGGLYTGDWRSGQLKQVKLIYDFNHFQFESRCAPY